MRSELNQLTQYNYRVIWSEEDQEFVGLCAEFPSLSWLDKSEKKALHGIRNVVKKCVVDLGDHDPAVY